jgi:hypothetical protein
MSPVSPVPLFSFDDSANATIDARRSHVHPVESNALNSTIDARPAHEHSVEPNLLNSAIRSQIENEIVHSSGQSEMTSLRLAEPWVSSETYEPASSKTAGDLVELDDPVEPQPLPTWPSRVQQTCYQYSIPPPSPEYIRATVFILMDFYTVF